MYYSSREGAELIVIGRSTNLSVCQRMDEFGLPTIRYKVFCDRNCNKSICVVLYTMIRLISMRL